MKLQIILASLFATTILFSCSSDEEITVPDVPDSGIYITEQFEESDLLLAKDVPYSIRNNYGGIQYTADNRRALETGLDELTIHLDIAIPPNAVASSPQPLIVYIHGGGFTSGSKEDTYDKILGYAKAGYVVATINYRLTPNNQSSVELRTLAVSHAVEDGMNAIRFLKENGAIYHIDVTRIAVIGSSAGGGIALTNAIGADELGFESDYPSNSAKVQATISTGATLTGDSLIDKSALVFDGTDCPALLFHNNAEDPVTGATWQNALETEKLFDDSGNSCSLVAQPSDTHTVSLALGGKYWNNMKSFLWEHLRLYEIR
jgi:dienelactone hydrolase